MEKIEAGKFVELIYDVYEVTEPNEILMFKFTKENPDNFVYGIDNGMLEVFAKNIKGLKEGEKFDIILTPEEAFGPYADEYVMEFEKEMFLVDGEFDDERIKAGNSIEMMSAEGHRIPGLVLEVTADKVKIDFNHPLAGQKVHFVGEVGLVRDATPEELNPQHGGCCGGDHECGDGGCNGCH